VAEGKADAVSLGIQFISHPDLVKRVEHGKPLDNPVQFGHLYGGQNLDGASAAGYIDYPEATY